MSLKKETNLFLHIIYVLSLFVFGCLVCLNFFLFSFETLLIYFNYPLMVNFKGSTIFPAVFSSALTCFLPPIFLIGAVRKYSFQERLMRIFEVQGFFYLVLILGYGAGMFYTVNLEDNALAIRYAYFFVALTHLLLGLYFYLSIKVCIASQDMPLPPDWDRELLEHEKECDRKSGQCEKEYKRKYDDEYENNKFNKGECNKEFNEGEINKDKHSQEYLNKNHVNQSRYDKNALQKNKTMQNEAWKKHQEKLPVIVKISLNIAQLMGFALFFFAFFSLSIFPKPYFPANYSFFAVFFLYFYLLYQMRRRPYGVWRPAYAFLILYIFVFYGLNEVLIWKTIFLAFFLVQCFIIHVLYKKSENYFLF